MDERICFSSRSPNLEGAARGGGNWSAGIAGSTSIIEMFGTSQDSPHVAGLVALLLIISHRSKAGAAPARVGRRERGRAEAEREAMA